MSDKRTFRLSAEEAKYISTLMSQDRSFSNLLPSPSEFCIYWEALTVDHDEVERLRDYFTDRLARVGLDQNYEPNEEGVMLERLTDILFLPDEKWSAG